MNKRKILITGGCGFLGSNLVRYLNDIGCDVVVVDDLSESDISNLDVRSIFYKVDCACTEKIEPIFASEKFDYVFHFAAMANECLSHWVRNYCIRANILSTTNIINACVKYGIKKLIFTSSIAAYGIGNPPFKEEDILNPIDIYGLSKEFSERDIKMAHEMFGLNYTILRPFNIFGGKYQNLFSLYRNVISIWLRNVIWENGDINIYGTGECVRSFSDVRFLLPVFEKLLNIGDNRIYNIGAEKSFRIIDAAKTFQNIAKEFGFKSEIKFLAPRHEVKVALSDNSKAQLELGFKDETNLEESIRQMFKWALTQEYKKPPYIQYELEKGIYNFWKK